MGSIENLLRMRDLVEKFVAKHGRLPVETDPDYLEMLQMSKYIIKDVPPMNPGKCANCGASKNDGRKYIDFGLQVDWYGVVYLCGECLSDIARTMGLFKNLETKLVEAELALVAVENMQTKGEKLHDTLVSMFKEFEEYYAGLHSIGNNSSINNSTGDVPVETTSESRIDSTESRTTESATSSRSKDVRSLADLLNEQSD